MANRKVVEPRVQMRVPESFRDRVNESASECGMTVASYLERCKTVRIEND